MAQLSSWPWLAALGALACFSGCSCSAQENRQAAQAVGGSAARSLAHAIEQEAGQRDPYRCARIGLPKEELIGRAGGRELRITGNVATLAERANDSELVIGIVADARGALSADQGLAERMRSAFRQAKIEFLLVLGGMAEDEEPLAAAYRGLADSSWVLVAQVGDRERVPAMRSAIAKVHSEDAPVIDGTRVSFVEGDGVVIGNFPGVARAEQLAGGREGCVHTRADAKLFAEALAEKPGTRVWASYAPPRQQSVDASDIAIGGIHIGERELSEALAASRAVVAVHGLLDEAAASRSKGESRHQDNPLVLGAGSLDPLPVRTLSGQTVRSAALVVRVSDKRTRWTRLTQLNEP